jgi:hypothetical protein
LPEKPNVILAWDKYSGKIQATNVSRDAATKVRASDIVLEVPAWYVARETVTRDFMIAEEDYGPLAITRKDAPVADKWTITFLPIPFILPGETAPLEFRIDGLGAMQYYDLPGCLLQLAVKDPSLPIIHGLPVPAKYRTPSGNVTVPFELFYSASSSSRTWRKKYDMLYVVPRMTVELTATHCARVKHNKEIL